MATFKQFLAEASRGIEKWEKYFMDGDTETITKNAADLYDQNGKKVGDIAKGEQITVISGEYDPRPQVIYNGMIFRMRLSDIEKPTKKALAVKIHLKPDVLGLDDTFEFKVLDKKIKDAIDKSPDISGDHAEFAKALVDHAADPNDKDAKEAVVDLYEVIGSDRSFLNTINNDFMEVLGPFFVAQEKPEFKNGKVTFPSLGNEPLYDFEMRTESSVQFSSKRTGGRTNTLKAEHVWKSVQDNLELKKKHKLEMELLGIIKDTPIKLAGTKINEWLGKNFRTYQPAPVPSQDNFKQLSDLERAVVKWINDSSKLDFLPLIRDALPNLWYVKARLNSDGTIKIEPLKNARDIKKTELRSKNSPGHLADRLGFVV